MRTGSETKGWPLRNPSIGAGGDVLAVRVDEDLLLAVRDHQEAVLVDPADVARVEPAVRVDRLGGLLRLVEVALHDVRSARQDLPVRRDAALDAGHDLPHRAEPPRGRAGEGDDRARLREAVALVDLDADRPEELRELFREGRAAGDREPEPRAERRAHLAVHEPLEDEVLEREREARRLLLRAQLRDLLPDLDRLLEELPLAGRGLREVLLHAPVDLLVDAGDRAEEVRVHLGEVVAQLVDRLRVRDRGRPVVVGVLDACARRRARGAGTRGRPRRSRRARWSRPRRRSRRSCSA